MKYSKEFKLECVMKYKNGEHINVPLGVRNKSFRNQIRRWVKIFESMGEYGLDHNRPTITVKQRIKLFMRVENGESYTKVANSVGIQEGLLIKWHNIYLQNGIEGLKYLKRGKKKMKKELNHSKSLDQMTPEEKNKYYEERLEYLEAENAYLKKLRALVQKKKDQQREKK